MSALEERVLIVAPIGRDGPLMAQLLSATGLPVQCCGSLAQCCVEARNGAAALLLVQESLTQAELPLLRALLVNQPPWSDLPVIILSRPGTVEQQGLPDLIGSSSTYTLLERPMRQGTFVSAVETACRARRRQYLVKQLLNEQSRANEALSRQAALIDLSPDGIFVRKVDGTITFWNEGAHALYGWTKEEAVNGSSRRLLRTEFPEPESHIIEQVRTSGRWAGEVRQYTRDGRVLTLHSRWLGRRSEGGEMEILEYNSDITERKRAELRTQVLVDLASALLETGEAQAVLKDICVRALPVLNAEVFLAFMSQPGDTRFHLIASEGVDAAQVSAFMRAQGSDHTALGLASPVLTTEQVSLIGARDFVCQPLLVNGKLAGSLCFARRNSVPFAEPDRNLVAAMADHLAIALERERARTELERANTDLEKRVDERTRELRETNEQLNSFCYSIAHDLKAPIRAQVAFANLLEEEFASSMSDDARDYARRIAEAAERQGRLVGDLLSHMSLSRADLPLKPVNLSQLVDQVRTDLVLEIQQKNADVQVSPFEVQVMANPASLHLVVLNLVSNALKFVPRGKKPCVRVWAYSQDESVRLVVQDNGIGIPREYQHKLFGVFQRLHTGEQYPGTGIGLAIVKRAVERMGGRVGADSVPGKGSSFWVELPKAEERPESGLSQSSAVPTPFPEPARAL